jgi:hypothetical protein
MENEFVTYEQALALKELGFDEKCFKYWVGEIHEKSIEFVLDSEKLNDDELFAPLKQQVFRWFRENYNKNSFIELVYQDGLKYDYVLYVDKKKEECENYGDGPFNTYEEAENACIDKLIEIVKESKS